MDCAASHSGCVSCLDGCRLCMGAGRCDISDLRCRQRFGRRRHPRRDRRRHEQRDRDEVRSRDQHPGAFTVPALSAGIYTVTVSLEGFKTAVDHRRPRAARHSDDRQRDARSRRARRNGHRHRRQRRAHQHADATVAATLNVDQIAQIPTPTRDLLLNAVTFLVGVNQTTTSRGNATVNGLPESFLNITLDGVSNNDNFNKSTDGFFAPVRPRQDAIEAVTGRLRGGRRRRRRPRRDLDQLRDAAGHQPLHAAAPTSTYRHPTSTRTTGSTSATASRRTTCRLNQFGVRQGGPIVIPGLYDGRGKAFFFVHYEELRLPNNASRDPHAAAPARAGRLVPLQRARGQASARSTCSIWRAPTARSRRPIRCVMRTLGYINVGHAEDRRGQRVERSAAR